MEGRVDGLFNCSTTNPQRYHLVLFITKVLASSLIKNNGVKFNVVKHGEKKRSRTLKNSQQNGESKHTHGGKKKNGEWS